MAKIKTNTTSIFSIGEKTAFFMLFLVITGIFLLPLTAWLTTINANNIVALTNEARSQEGLSALIVNPRLEAAARRKAEDIFANQQFSHNLADRKFSTWIKEAGYEYSYAGENLAMDFYTAEGVLEAWLNSPSHKHNLLSGHFSEIGVAVVEGELNGQNTTMIVQAFGAPLPASPLPLHQDPTLMAVNPEWHLNHVGATALITPNQPQAGLTLSALAKEGLNKFLQNTKNINLDMLTSLNILLTICLLLIGAPILVQAYLKNQAVK